jgi:sarcosine oxidase delta subunit
MNTNTVLTGCLLLLAAGIVMALFRFRRGRGGARQCPFCGSRRITPFTAYDGNHGNARFTLVTCGSCGTRMTPESARKGSAAYDEIARGNGAYRGIKRNEW